MHADAIESVTTGVFELHGALNQGCGNTMPDLSDLVPFHLGQVENFTLLVLRQVQNLYRVNKFCISYFD